MALQPIVLDTPKATLASDDACNTVFRYEYPPLPFAWHAPYYRPPSAETNSVLSYVPPLIYFCIKALLEYPDHVHGLGPARLHYEPPTDGHAFDILQALIPTYRPFSPNHEDFDLRMVDPRLWAVLIQIYEGLPALFREYTLPLSDHHLPLLQTIPSTDFFSLVTVLSLAKCRELTDDSVLKLRDLHTLAALDASVTALGSWGVQRLAKSLDWTEGDNEQYPERRGPWGLRVLYLKDCINIDDTVLAHLPRFPLLSVVDLRGTVCKPWRHRVSSFSSSSDKKLFKPGALSEVLGHLATLTKERRTLFSHPAPYVLNVDSLHHKVDPTPSYRLPSNIWGAEGPDSQPEQRLVQVARHGGMEVFIPRKLPRSQYESPPHEEYEPFSGYKGEVDEDEYGQAEDAYNPDEPDTDNWEEPDSGPSEPWNPYGGNLTPRRVRRHAMPERESHTWMNEVADEELAQYKKQLRVNRFYASSGPRRASSLSNLSSAGANSIRTTSDTTSHAPPDPLMLFRIPPPWNSLPSFPPAKPSGTVKATATLAGSNTPYSAPSDHMHPPSPKRRRMEDVVPADQARKRMVALSSIRSIHSMIQQRAVDAQAKAAHPTRPQRSEGLSSGVQAKMNPFAWLPGAQSRKTPGRLDMRPAGPPSPKIPPKSKSAPKSKTLTPALGHRPGVGATDTDGTEVRRRCSSDSPPTVPKRQPVQTPIAPPNPPDKALLFGSPHPSGKKLKPITTLPVPDFPVTMKPLSAHRPQAPSPVKAKKQTVLPVVRDAALPMPKRPLSASKSVVAKPMSGRRVSAPASVPNRLSCGPAEATAKRKNVPAQPTGKAGPKAKGKTLGGEKGFDWKGWSVASERGH